MPHPTPPTPRPAVWVGCLACYNAGALTGAWFDAVHAPQEMTVFNVAIIGTAGPAEHANAAGEGCHEELWCFDRENFAGLLVGECSPAQAVQLAELICELTGEGYPPSAYAAYRDDIGSDYATLEGFRDAYCGEYDTEADYAQQLADELGYCPTTVASWPLSCIDWHRAWRELHYGGDNYSATAPAGGVYIFRAS